MKKYLTTFSIKGAKVLSFGILKNFAYNMAGFTAVIVIWGSVFIVLRQPWRYLIKKKYGLIYCSIYLLVLVILIEEYSYLSLIKAVKLANK